MNYSYNVIAAELGIVLVGFAIEIPATLFVDQIAI